MALGLTQSLTEKSTRNISWGKGGRCVELTTLPPSCVDHLEIWEPQPPGTLRVPVQAFTGIALPSLYTMAAHRPKYFGNNNLNRRRKS